MGEEEEEEEEQAGGESLESGLVGEEAEEKKSRQEVRTERLARRIQRMEEANMAEAHWTMKGEVKASQRPENSLLEVDLDFQHSSNPPLEPTQEIADELEEIIKARILE